MSSISSEVDKIQNEAKMNWVLAVACGVHYVIFL